MSRTRAEGEEEVDLSQFEAFYKQQMPGLVAFIMWLGAGKRDAENIAQETMLRAYEGWTTIEYPRAWIRVVASREHFRGTRSRRADPVSNVPEISCPAGDAGVMDQEQSRVLALLQRLPPRQRQIIALVYDGYTPKEIADLLDMEPNAVRGSLHKARQALKAALAQEGRQVS